MCLLWPLRKTGVNIDLASDDSVWRTAVRAFQPSSVSYASPKSQFGKSPLSLPVASNCSAVMHSAVACRAKRNEVLLRIVAGLATEFFVMNLEIRHCAAQLASPAVAAEHLVAELFVKLGLKPYGRSLWSDPIHDTFSAT